MPDEHAARDVDEHTLLGGRVRMRQAKRGYRAGLDAALLAAAVELAPGERALELGCGAGGALLQVAARSPGASLLGVDRDTAVAELARENAAINAWGDRIEIREGAVADGFPALGLARVDAAFANPPFFDDPARLRAPAPARRGAWMADDGLDAWCAYLLSAVHEDGRVTMIHRADRAADLLASFAAHGGGSLALRPVHSFADAPAKRVLIRAVSGGRRPLRLLPPLVMHARGEPPTPTAEADAVSRGDAALGW